MSRIILGLAYYDSVEGEHESFPQHVGLGLSGASALHVFDYCVPVFGINKIGFVRSDPHLVVVKFILRSAS